MNSGAKKKNVWLEESAREFPLTAMDDAAMSRPSRSAPPSPRNWAAGFQLCGRKPRHTPMSAALLKVAIDAEGALEIARRSRGTPRIANRLLRRVRDYAQVKGSGHIDKPVADKALAMLDVDPLGFDVMDRKLLEAVIHRFDGGPVGLDNVAAAIGEEPGTIEDVIEPFLIQQGFLQRTPRGRVATLAAWRHLGLAPPPRTADDLFA